MSLLEKTLVLPSGIELSYTEHGDRNGPALILLHGYTDSRRSFDPLTPHLPAWLRTIAFSLRGHGNSTKAPSAYRCSEHATDIAQAMDALAIRSAVVAGHSMSSMIAQRLALDLGGRVEGLILLGAFRTLAGNPAVEALHDEVMKMGDRVDPDFVRAFQESTVHKPVGPSFMSTVIEESCKVPAFVWRAALKAQLEESFTDELPRIAAPSLVIWGDRDAFMPYEEQLALTAALRRCELHVLPGAGHALHWEDPQTVAGLIARFTQRIQAAAA